MLWRRNFFWNVLSIELQGAEQPEPVLIGHLDVTPLRLVTNRAYGLPFGYHILV